MKTKNHEWEFNFCLLNKDETGVPEDTADELLDKIVEWAEEKGLCIGGGMRIINEEN